MPVLSTPPAPSPTIGGPGPQGPPGQSAYTYTTADTPGYNGTAQLTLPVQNTSWIPIPGPIFVAGLGSFSVVSTTANSVTLQPLKITAAGLGPYDIPNNTMVAASGFPGLNGATGSQGLPGATGPQGSQGPQGIQGPAGQTGGTGPAGPPGSTGAQGQQGPPGTTGATGSTGPQGPPGVKGDQGPQGIQGIQGSQGYQGQTGVSGPSGPPGPQGPPGPAATAQGVWNPSTIYAQGDLVTWNNLIYIALGSSQNAQPDLYPTKWAVYSSVGVQGPQGPIGPQGPPGVQGAQGPVGPQGVEGADGATGPVGQDGPAGPTGNPGPQGPPGSTGSTGAQGPAGPQGVPGPTVTWRGTWLAAATYNPNDGVTYNGSSYVATSTSTGSTPPSSSWQLIAQIGDTGATGAPGPIGPTGPVGPTGSTGPTGPIGPAGANGTAGLNAFNITVNGFVVPPIGQTIQVTLTDASWIVVGQFVYVDRAGGGIGQAGLLQVTAKTGNVITLLNPAPSPAQPLADASQPGLMAQLSGNATDYVGGDNASHNLVTAIQPVIWSVRLKTFSAVGNANFEVDQRNVGNTLANPAAGTIMVDRWTYGRSGTAACSIGQVVTPSPVVIVPGTNFLISRTLFRLALTTQQASLAAGDFIQLYQTIEGPNFRELINDVHSVSLLVRCTVAPLSFSLFLRDPGGTSTKSLVKLCTIPTANVFTLIPLPNLPVWPSGNFSTAPGTAGYLLGICLACGSTNMAPAADTWQNGSFAGAPGMTNFAAQAVNTLFDIAFVQHEPGPQCTQLIDKPFTQNLDECLRYFCKSYDYEVAVGSTGGTANAYISTWQQATTTVYGGVRYPKPMAKNPTVTIYNHSTGAANSMIVAGTTVTPTVTGPGKTGFGGIAIATGPAVVAGASGFFHYTADTGW